MTRKRAIGIDLGTTNTIVAVVNSAGNTEVLRTQEGESLIPSVVLLSDERAVVGREAELRGRAQPDRLAACVKQQLGQPYYNQRLGGESFPPEALEACILHAVKRQWFAQEEAPNVVIAVPAHFRESQRHAVSMAAEMAGLNLLDLVDEPVAAALAFAEHTPMLGAFPAVAAAPPQFVLVYDLGGYTFEASVLRVSPGKVELVASVRDSRLGGHDWDLRLADFLAEPFVRKGLGDPRNNPQLLDVLLQRAAQMKLSLSMRSHTAQHLSLTGQAHQFKLTREEFERMTDELVERTIKLCEQAMGEAQATWPDVRKVLLVGGATRMPMIRQRLTEFSGRPPADQVSPDEAVARGAALYAAALHQGRGAPPTLQVSTVSTHSLGIGGADQGTGRRINKILIPKGTPLPATVTREFVSGINSGHAVVFNVLEGENRDPAKCVTIGRVVLRDLPADMSEQWPIEVTYSYSATGRLTVQARVRYTDRHVELVAVRVGGVSQFHVARWKEAITAQGGMVAMRQVRSWERAADRAPPLVLAGIELPEPAPAPVETSSVLSFLKRMMPFVFRQTEKSMSDENAPPTDSSTSDAKADTSAASATSSPASADAPQKES